MQEMKPQSNVVDLLPKLKSMALADRAVFEKGMKAFVSYVQAYGKHECNLIFRIKGNSHQGCCLLLLFSDNKTIVVVSTSFSYSFWMSDSLSAPSDFDKTHVFFKQLVSRENTQLWSLTKLIKSTNKNYLVLLLVLMYRVQIIH